MNPRKSFMSETSYNQILEIVQNLAKDNDITSIGLSSHFIPQNKKDGDIDLFVYCKEIPMPEKRNLLYPEIVCKNEFFKSRVFVSEKWGDSDYCEINGIETWIMYFSEKETLTDFDSIIEGKQFAKNNGYYPTARLAMFKKMNILLDKDNFLNYLKNKVLFYPEKLQEKILLDCREKMDDEEDLIRAVTRKDVSFFHLSIDEAMDNLFQLLFAMNNTLFPSRKKNRELMKDFKLSPLNFFNRVCKIFFWGTKVNKMGKALKKFRELKKEISELYSNNFSF